MRNKVVRLLIAANMSMEAMELLEFKRKLFEEILEKNPDVLIELENDL